MASRRCRDGATHPDQYGVLRRRIVLLPESLPEELVESGPVESLHETVGLGALPLSGLEVALVGLLLEEKQPLAAVQENARAQEEVG